MKPEQARALVTETFPQPFDKGRFHHFVKELLNGFDETKAAPMQVPDAFAPHVRSCARLGTYESPDGELADVLIVHTTEPWKLERTRTALRDFVAHKLKRGDSYKEAGLVAFVAPDARSWRFSFVRMEYASKRDPRTGKIAVEERLTPARRFSYIVGENESCHTAQSRFLDLLQDTETKPTLAQIESAFSVETVTKEFFEQYKALFLGLKDELDKLAKNDPAIAGEFAEKKVSTADFAKKLMGQIVFLYFLQKKGWLGVPKGGDWGGGPHNFLRQLFDGKFRNYENFFNDILEHLFYDTLATDRQHEAWCDKFNCRIPFLNGGLFEPLRDYDWQKTDIVIPNKIFANADFVEQGVTGTGILDVFDRYNFTVNEAEPLEKEVAIDPEMLGKVFENLLGVAERKSKGSFYTPREIVHYMCQESLINYLDTAVNSVSGSAPAPGAAVDASSTASSARTVTAADGLREGAQTDTRGACAPLIPRADIETFIRSGDQASHYEAARVEGTSGKRQLPKSIEKHARLLDDALKTITVCDPAIGSGAFPVGMMQEIVRARSALNPYFTPDKPARPLTPSLSPAGGEGGVSPGEGDASLRTAYHFKRHAIQNCLYGVDIDPGAVEIAKLRLWLSLVVDEDDVKQIKPLPNLDYKVVVGNSLLGVEKNLFNAELFKRLEELKPKYFDATDRKQKEKFKREIDDLIHELTNGKEAFDFEIYFSEVFHHKKGFDVAIANPPYLNLTVNSYSAELLSAYNRRFSVFQGAQSKNLFAPFVEQGVRIANNAGVITYIVPEGLTNTRSYTPVRKLFTSQTRLNSLLIFDEFVFENAVIGNVVFIADHGEQTEVAVRQMNQSGNVKLLKRLSDSEIKSSDICEWKTRQSKNDLPDKISKCGYRLGSRFNFAKGMVVQNRSEHLRSRQKPAKGELPFLLGKNIGRYLLRYDNYTTYEELEIVGGTKVLGKHLATPRVLIRRTGDTVCATYSTMPELVESTLYIMTSTSGLELRSVLAILNSTLMTYYARQSFVTNQQAFPQIVMSNLVQLPIAEPSSEQKAQLVRLVDRILAAKQREAEADTSALEREIDELVYALYGLTPEEKALVQAAAK